MNPPRKKSSFDSNPNQHKLISEDSMDDIDRLVSLTFDENPSIRRSVVQDLSKHSQDPRALLALLELSSDKDEQISTLAKESLGTYKQADAEAFTSLEKFFSEAREDVPESPQEIASAKQRLLPSLEKLFSKNNFAKEKLLPSLEKLFSAQQTPSSYKDSCANVEQTNVLVSNQQSSNHDALDSIDYVHTKKSIIENAEKSVGVPIRMQNPREIHQKRVSSSFHPTQSQLDDSVNFPLPEHLHSRVYSPISSIPIMGDGEVATSVEHTQDYLPSTYLDFYKWAYAIALTPGIKASDVKKEKLRLISDCKRSIELAFKLAITRAREEGIESLAGLKPGMSKISTLPLEVLEHKLINIPKGKTKLIELSRLLLSDGKHSIPLYISPTRAQGIKTGDLVSLRNAVVDYQIKDANASSDSQKGEIVFTLAKNGQLTITK